MILLTDIVDAHIKHNMTTVHVSDNINKHYEEEK